MLNIIDYELILSLVITILLLFFQLRYPIRNAFRNLFIYLNILLLLEIFSTIILLNTMNPDLALMLARVRYIAQSFIPATLFHFSRNFSFTSEQPKFNLQNILVFLIATLIAVIGLTDYSIKSVQFQKNYFRIEFGPLYLLYIIYSNIIFYLIFIKLISQYKQTRRKDEINKFKELTVFILPLLYATVFMLYQLPFYKIFPPIIYSGYLILSVALFYGALRFYFIDPEKILPILNPHFPVGAILLLFTFLFVRQPLGLGHAFVATVGFLLYMGLSSFITTATQRIVSGIGGGVNQSLESNLMWRSNEIIGIVNKSELWEYVATFFKEHFPVTKVAIITSRYDVSPYQIEFADGYEPEKLHQLISNNASPLLEAIEEKRGVINKFEHHPDSMIFRILNDLKIYLIIPLIVRGELRAIIFLGGERRYCQFSQRQLNILQMISMQISYALNNILIIEETVQSQKMAELGRFASQMAHDFQSLITIVKLEAGENERLRRHASYMERLVQDLLNYARPQELKLSPTNINNLLDMSLDLVEIPSNVLVEKHYSNNLPRIYVDVNQMQRVFTNLFDNSIRAMRNNQKTCRLKISTKPLRPLSAVHRNPWIYIEILDEGEGIPEEFLNRIFDPFFTTHKDSGGNGMGLAIVRQIIVRHQGHIDVTSKPGKGTIFNIRLPFITNVR